MLNKVLWNNHNYTFTSKVLKKCAVIYNVSLKIKLDRMKGAFMSENFNVRLNGVDYDQNNIPKEIQLNGKTEKEDILSVFDQNKDGKLSAQEIKDAIFSIVKEEEKISGANSDSIISNQEADIIAKSFMNGKFKIGENIQNLVKELQSRIKIVMDKNSTPTSQQGLKDRLNDIQSKIDKLNGDIKTCEWIKLSFPAQKGPMNLAIENAKKEIAELESEKTNIQKQIGENK